MIRLPIARHNVSPSDIERITNLYGNLIPPKSFEYNEIIKTIERYQGRAGLIHSPMIYDAYPAAATLAAEKNWKVPMLNSENREKVISWLRRVYDEGYHKTYTWWTEEHECLVRHALYGESCRADNPFIAMYINDWESVRRFFKRTKYLLLFLLKLNYVPEWARYGILALLSGSGVGGLVERMSTYDIKKSLQRLYDEYEYDTPFASYHYTPILIKISSKLCHRYTNKLLKLLNDLVHPWGYLSRYTLPVWNTAWLILGLRSDDPRLVNYCSQLTKVAVEKPMFGFSFSDYKMAPDADDTAVVGLAMVKCCQALKEKSYCHIATELAKTLLKVQRRDGGWATYFRGTQGKDRDVLPSIAYPEGLIWTNIDVPLADITGHALWFFSELASISNEWRTKLSKSIAKAVDWMYADMIINGRYGYFYGRWEQTFIPTTAHAIVALHKSLRYLDGNRKKCAEEVIEMSLKWLKRCRRCRENYMSYHVGKPVIEDKPSIEHTLFVRTAILEVEGRYYSPSDLTKVRWPYVNMAAFDLYTDTLLPYQLLLIYERMAEMSNYV